MSLVFGRRARIFLGTRAVLSRSARTDRMEPMDSESANGLGGELEQQSAWMRRLARRLVSGVAGAEDALAQARLAALRRERAGERVGDGWVARATLNFARREQRDEAVRRAHEQLAARSEALPPADELAARLDAQRTLADELRALAEPYRSTLVRRFFDGWSAARIAREAGVPATTVRTRIERGLELLRERLDRRNGGRREWLSALAPLAFPSLPRWLDWPSAPVSQLIQGALFMKVGLQVASGVAILAALGAGWLWIDGESEAALPQPAIATPAAPLEPLSAPRDESAQRSALPPAREPSAPSALVASPTEVERVSPATATVQARVVDNRLRPLAGARASVGQRETRADAEGRVELTLEHHSPSLLRVEAPGHALMVVEFVPQPGASKHLGDIVLERGASVAGRVEHVDGRPLGGARVLATTPSMWESDLESAKRCGPDATHRAPVTHSSADGSFLLEGVTPGGVRVWAEFDGMRYGVSGALVARAGERLDGVVLVVEALQLEDEIAGVVLTPDGRPATDANLQVLTSANGSTNSFSIALDTQSRFRFRVRRAVAHTLTASDRLDRWPAARRPDVSPGEQAVELRFTPGRTINVHARGPARDEPLRFEVKLLDERGAWPLDSAALWSDANGRCELRVPGQAFVVECSAPHFAPARRGPFDPSSAPRELEFVLEPRAGLSGRVFAGDRALAGASVSLWRASKPLEGVEIDGYPALRHPSVVDRAVTDSEGHYFLRPREDGVHFVRAQVNGLAASELGPLEVQVGAGQDELDLALGAGGAIEGRVLVAEGRSDEGLIVVVNRGDGYVLTRRSSAGGYFRFDGLTPGPWSVTRGRVEVDGSPFSNWAVSDTSTPTQLEFNCKVREGVVEHIELDLRDDEPAHVRGRLTIDGAPAASWVLTAWPGDRSSHSGELPNTALDAHGEFELSLDDPGPVRLTFSSGVADGEASQFSLRTELRRGANEWSANVPTLRVRGRSARVTGERYSLLVNIKSDQASASLPIHTDAQGQFELPRAIEGRAKFIGARIDGGTWREVEDLLEIELVRGATPFIELR